MKNLSNAIGLSGEEDEVRHLLIKAVRSHADDLLVDALGNLIVFQRGTSHPACTVMVAAHMDEVGLMVTAVDNNGLLQFTNVGGIDARILPGLRVKVGADRKNGVVLWKPIHMGRDMKTVEMDSLRIDVGATDSNAAGLGERIAFDAEFKKLSETVVRGKALDDRVGCSLLVDILAGGPYPVTVAAAFTAQEEIGLRGATVAARRINPDAAVVLEGTPAFDVPDPTREAAAGDLPGNPATRMGAGVVLTLADASMVSDPRVIRFLQETADAQTIPYQMKTVGGGGTDGGAIHTAQTGVPTMTLSVPCRYIHSPSALLDLNDYDSALRLSQAVLRRIDSATFQRG
ncbi:MAG: M20/M25/M40 family metallo-hydrolase [Chloroflexi bacterium]|nr:M20/M25/M40 family metallo-hydrolase [Chloroflexota bacterium]